MKMAVIVLMAWIQVAAATDLVINEAMVNEPDQFVSLEWIELHLPDSATGEAQLLDYRLFCDGIEVVPYQPISFRPGDYLVLCRQLYGGDGRPGFESVWGDNSGVWGDHDAEVCRVIQADHLALTNPGGSISLVRNDTLVSVLSWYESGDDGVSWERSPHQAETIQQCHDTYGSTPGRVNSIAPIVLDLSLSLVGVYRHQDVDRLQLQVDNHAASASAVPVTVVDEATGLVVASQHVAVDAAGSTQVSFDLQLLRPYQAMVCRLPDDVTPDDNSLTVRSPGNPFPPIILTEIMAAPEGALTTEWLELYNRTDDTVIMHGWSLADPYRSGKVADSTVLPPRSFLVLADNAAAFSDFYADHAADVVQLSSWPPLNNDADTVLLVDQWGNTLDRACYVDPPKNNRTLVRRTREPSAADWLPSLDAHGSPGRGGDAFVLQTGANVEVTVSSRYINTTAGESIDVSLVYPDATSFTLRIYDRNGNVVRTLIDDTDIIPATVGWDGRGDDSRRLPIGPYVIFFDVAGVGSAKQVVVVR